MYIWLALGLLPSASFSAEEKQPMSGEGEDHNFSGNIFHSKSVLKSSSFTNVANFNYKSVQMYASFRNSKHQNTNSHRRKIQTLFWSGIGCVYVPLQK